MLHSFVCCFSLGFCEFFYFVVAIVVYFELFGYYIF